MHLRVRCNRSSYLCSGTGCSVGGTIHGANEMAALSALLLGSGGDTSSRSVGGSGAGSSSREKGRPEAIDQFLETALYSYVTRCVAPYSALRSLAMATELLRLRGPSSAD